MWKYSRGMRTYGSSRFHCYNHISLPLSSVHEKLPNEEWVAHFHKLINPRASETNCSVWVMWFHICYCSPGHSSRHGAGSAGLSRNLELESPDLQRQPNTESRANSASASVWIGQSEQSRGLSVQSAVGLYLVSACLFWVGGRSGSVVEKKCN